MAAEDGLLFLSRPVHYYPKNQELQPRPNMVLDPELPPFELAGVKIVPDDSHSLPVYAAKSTCVSTGLIKIIAIAMLALLSAAALVEFEHIANRLNSAQWLLAERSGIISCRPDGQAHYDNQLPVNEGTTSGCVHQPLVAFLSYIEGSKRKTLKLQAC